MISKTFIFLFLLGAIGCASPQASKDQETHSDPFKNPFKNLEGCFLLYNLKTNQFEKVIGENRCKQRYPACSTFKWPLAVMAFDSGILKDENTPMKWDGVKWKILSWNQDQTAASWMKNSVVWYSQRITPRLGKNKIQKYLKDFHYGNEDFSGGLTSACLTVSQQDTDPGKGTLKLNAYEQTLDGSLGISKVISKNI